MSDVPVVPLLIATLGAAAVGLERQWSGHANGKIARFAGIRTFTMFGLTGGLAGYMWTAGLAVLASILLAGAAAIVAVAYFAHAADDIDSTTEVAAIVVLTAAVLAGIGQTRLASAVFTLVTLLLVEKSRLHSMVTRIDDVGLRSGVRFAAMALVVLPLLPEGPYGPWGGIRPRELWMLVLFFSGLSFAGYMARRLFGAGRGYFLTGLLGGLVSSTNVTLTFARLSRRESAQAAQLAFGTIAANGVLFPRVMLAVIVLNATVLPELWPYFAAPAAIAAAVAAFGALRKKTNAAGGAEDDNPLGLSGALQMAALFQAVLFVMHAVREAWGQGGVLASAAVLGLTDVDALTLSMTRNVAGSLSPAVAAAGIAVGVASNTLLKLGLAVALGSSRFRLIVGGTLVAMLAALATVLVLRLV